jgi:anaerobic magnesium-protoporphyrin IX monomethyl ester cyclase
VITQISFRMTFRIAFIQAPLGRPEPLIYPLGIVTLAGAVPKQHTVNVFDPNLYGVVETEAQIEQFCPDIICLSIRNLDSQIRRDLFYYYLHLKEHIKRLRAGSPDSVIVAGGAGFSLFPEKIMKDNPELDLGVFLEADQILPQLLQHLNNPSRVKGVYYRSGSDVIFTGIPELPAPEAFGRPRYDVLDPRPYQANGGVGVQTKRGCPLNCIYCTYPHLNGSELRLLPLDNVLSEIRVLKQDYGINNITFVDGIFNIPRTRAEQLLTRMKAEQMDIQWRAWFTERAFDRSFAELCRDTGCPEFSFSPDGFSSETLKQLGKTTRREDIERIFNIARETPGIRVAFNFFWNPPGQTLGNWLKMMMFTLRCKLVLREKAGGIIFGNPRIEPYTPLMDIAIQSGVLSDETDLLPNTADELKKTFYSNPSTKYLDTIYAVYEKLWKIRRRLLHS